MCVHVCMAMTRPPGCEGGRGAEGEEGGGGQFVAKQNTSMINLQHEVHHVVDGEAALSCGAAHTHKTASQRQSTNGRAREVSHKERGKTSRERRGVEKTDPTLCFPACCSISSYSMEPRRGEDAAATSNRSHNGLKPGPMEKREEEGGEQHTNERGHAR